MAIGVLDECYDEDEVLAEMLVEREIPKWGGMCALNLAAAAHGEKFLAHPCCQSSLNSIWKSRGMPGVPYWKVCGRSLEPVQLESLRGITGHRITVLFQRNTITVICLKKLKNKPLRSKSSKACKEYRKPNKNNLF